MCDGQGRSFVRTDSILFIFSAVLIISGSCQNMELRDSFERSELMENEHRRDDYDSAGTSDQRFKWEGFDENGSNLDEHVVAPAGSSLVDTNAETKTETPSSNGNNKKKVEMSKLTDGDDVESTTKSFVPSSRCNTARGTKRRFCINESRLKKRRRYANGGRDTNSDTRLSLRNRIRGSSSRSRKIQERGHARATNRGRKRNGKRTKQRENGERTRSRKNKSSRINAEAPEAFHQVSNGKLRNSSETPEAFVSKDSQMNETAAMLEGSRSSRESEMRDKNFNVRKDVDSDNTIVPSVTEPSTVLFKSPEENVEHEFSKNLEKEILWSRTELPRIQDENFATDKGEKILNSSVEDEKIEKSKFAGERITNDRFDAAKILGYSRSAEDLPIIDLENEVLARTLKDYNAYLKSGGKSTKLLRHASEWSDKTKNLHENHRKNVQIPVRPSYDERELDKSDETMKKRHRETEELVDSDVPTVLEGDLSCINGIFVPAPSSRHALIKYVKSSIPGHEYLEADYECTPGYYMTSLNSKLLCKNRQWVGELPNCKIRHSRSGSCSESSCDQICNEVDDEAKCSCYKGFRPNGHKCIDINECDSENGNCEYTCINTPGSYRCECPQGMKKGEDKFTCIDVDECYVPDLQTEICHYGCVNTPGSYRCIDPTELDDEPIRDTISTICFPGYKLSTDSNCIDINECAINNGGCSEVCENTEGSFFCACDGDEKALSADGKSCTDINNLSCSPLDPARRGYLVCSRETTPKLWRDVRRAANQPGTKCYLKCPSGYQLHGEYELTCQEDGSWDGPKHGECVKYSKPRLECPKDVVAEIPPDRDEAFVTFDQPSTDLDWFRYVRSKPSWGTRLEASLKPGLHLVTFFARHPVSKKQASCILRIIVKEGEAPKVNDCPNDIIGKNGTSFAWTEPTFVDNVGVTRKTKNESPGKAFGIGEWKIVYEASDEAGWTTRCVFSVVVHQD